jgi:hypothetical protein
MEYLWNGTDRGEPYTQREAKCNYCQLIIKYLVYVLKSYSDLAEVANDSAIITIPYVKNSLF